MARIVGGKAFKAKLNKLSGPALVREVGKAVFVAADMVSTESALSITEGAISGAGHIPSKPGEPPNADTHQLDDSIHTEMTGPTTAQSVVDAPHAVPLEKGTSRMIERPYHAPALQRVRPRAIALLKAAVERVSKGQAL